MVRHGPGKGGVALAGGILLRRVPQDAWLIRAVAFGSIDRIHVRHHDTSHVLHWCVRQARLTLLTLRETFIWLHGMNGGIHERYRIACQA